jgi:hypothetical protein
MLSSLLAQSWMQIAKCSSDEASFFFVQRENDKNTWNVYFYLNLAGISFASTLGPCLDHLKIPSFFALSPSHQFLAACMEY